MNQVQQFLEYILNSFKIWIIVQPWELGIRVRLGKKIKPLRKGIYFKIPYIDSVYVQEIRLRVVSMPVQTSMTLDEKTVTFSAVIGYTVEDIEKLYQTLYHPEQTIINIAMSESTKYLSTQNLKNISFDEIEKNIISKINSEKYGLNISYYKLTNFAAVRTYRLIQDGNWFHEGNDMNKKK
jgi:hypothetical protein